jgi:Spy/CpxP family protein refolding chaperone
VDQTGAAMAELQPAFAAFYAALTPEQQERLNSWLRHHHGSET